MTYDLAEHRHRFAVWAAARAAQRGFTTVKKLRDAIEATDIRTVLSDARTLQLSAMQFDALHRKWCSSICSSLTRRGVSNVTYGRAAKLVAVYLKAAVIMGEGCGSSLGHNLHPPIDRILLRSLLRSGRLKTVWSSVNWTQLDEATYYDLIAHLRDVVSDGAPFWTIEEHWQPSDSESATV